MVKWKANSCLRCGGTTYQEKDGNDTYRKCLMCSSTIKIVTPEKKNSETDEKKITARG